MNLAELKKKGAVVVETLVKKEVQWTHSDPKGKKVTDKFTVHVRRHTYGKMEVLFASDDPEKSRNASYLSETILLGPKGDEPLPYEDAMNLDPELGWALMKAVNEVNHPAKS
ncbi:phage tail assembly chaperone family protein, TAC [Pseudomonas viridiflava]|uniref:phage tail assembly chaperone family protein, TAC n=1 Tax=Pseudomonas viridiflava TaxID=33069 RepID=UPI000F019C0B|nr:phage tail assembly chaperone family protein, TAC [Pseudomonas viridiflava]MBI6684549.1 phage tail assembly chaperone family protein, TAC [Pseudomonas viridiflava]